VRAAPGVVDVILAADVPGVNDVGPIVRDDPILADGVVMFAGQPVFAVAATSVEAARRAALLAKLDLAPLAADPVDRGRDGGEVVRAAAGARDARRRGRRARARAAPAVGHRAQRRAGPLLPRRPGRARDPARGRHDARHLLDPAPGRGAAHGRERAGRDEHDVVVECRRMGGGFGGKETQMSLFACVAAILARRTGRAVKLRLDRDDDMRSTGKRHAFVHGYDVGYDDEGRILALDLTMASRCGFSADLSGPVNDRAVFHADNAYWLPDVAIHSYRCKTHTVPTPRSAASAARRACSRSRRSIDEIARATGRDPLDVRKANLYGTTERNVTPFGMTIEDNIAPPLIDRLERTVDYRERRAEIAAWNEAAR
jgi:xanthine dehydrogenase large subunit